MTSNLLHAVRAYTEIQTGESPFVTEIKGVTIFRSERERLPRYMLLKPALCVVVQGAKYAIFGDRRCDYRAGQALVVSLEMPALGAIAEASPAEPYLGVVVEFDLPVMRAVMEELANPPKARDHGGRGVSVTNFDGPLADCVLRMVRLLSTPEAIPVLYPAAMRELCYWLLTGPHGGEVAMMALAHGHESCVLEAIHTLRTRFAEPVRVEELAAVARMSASAFYRRFKRMTSMTPLQYQKQLRLLEAQRLMVATEANAETAAFRVGYESPSQFSREYMRMFGMPPRRNAVSLRLA